MSTFDLHAELRAITTALDAAGVEHAVRGALALAVHGLPRATKDIDLLVAPSAMDRAKLVVRALGYVLSAAPMTFRNGVTVHRISRVEGKELITLDLLEATGPIADMLADRTRLPWLDGTLAVVSRASLVAMKRLAQRPQDVAALAALGEEGRDG